MAASISERCRSCISSLKSVCSAAVDQPEQARRINLEQAKDNLERLSLWMGNIGARHAPKSPLSLESRLRNDGELLGYIHELLGDLAEVAGELFEIASGDREGDSDFIPTDQEGTEHKDEQTALLEEIRGCITRLFRTSSLIRQAAPTDLFAKALSRDRYKFIDQFDIAHVGHKYPKLATEDSAWLRTRLGRAITQRRHYLSYIQDHRGKLEEVDEHDNKTGSVAQNIKEQHQDLPTTSVKLDLASRPSTFITKASSIQPGRITTNMLTADGDSDHEDDAKSYTTISRSVDGDSESPITDRVPNLDDLQQGPKNQIECPFCFRMKKFKNNKTWLKHVFSDLRSYVCTYPECEGLYFGDINEWFRHEMENHRVRYACQLCSNKVYERKEHYFSHVQKQHPSLLEHGEKHLILDIARQPLEEIPAQDCPCCLDWVDRIRDERLLPPGAPVRVIPTIFKRHVASHLEQLALFAVPIGSMAAEADSNVAIEAAADVPSPVSDHSAFEFASPNRSPASSQAHEDEPQTLASKAQDPFESAETLEEQVEIRKTKLGADHHDTLRSMMDLASVYRDQGRLEEAEPLFVHVTETRKTKLGVDHLDTLTSMEGQALIYGAQGRYISAEGLFLQVVETRKISLGADHSDTLTSVAHLALMYTEEGRLDEAEALFNQLIETRQTKLGAFHPDTLSSMDDLVYLYGRKCLWKEAQTLGKQVIERRQAELGVDHPDTLASMANLAVALHNNGKWVETQEIIRQTIEAATKTLWLPDTLKTMCLLASLLHTQGKNGEAEEIYRQTLKNRTWVLGERNPDTLAAMSSLASVILEQGKKDEAENIYRRTLEARIEVIGERHPDTLKSMSGLASALQAQGKSGEAEELCRQALKEMREVLGKRHPDTLNTMENLARILQTQGKHEEEQGLMNRVHQGRMRNTMAKQSRVRTSRTGRERRSGGDK